MDETLIPLGILVDLPICLHVPDQDYMVLNTETGHGYYYVMFSKVEEDKSFDRLGSVTRQFRYSKVMVGFPGSYPRPIGPDKDPATGEERWQKIVAPGHELSLHEFNRDCILPLVRQYGFENIT